MAIDVLVELNPGTRVSKRWTIVKKLGAGAFGAVYLCTDEHGTQAALKTEPAKAPQPLLVMEATVLQSLEVLRPGEGRNFCRCLDLGRDQQQDAHGRTSSFNYIVMTLAGPGLDGLLRTAGDRFSPGTALGVSIQLLNAIKALHSRGFLHRDIKPANAAIGRKEVNEQQLVYMIDFGMARRYLRPDGTQRRPRAMARFRGTPVYAPISAHNRVEYSRKDDVESWFYVLIKLYKGAVPWKFEKNMDEMGKKKALRLDPNADVRRQALAELIGGCPDEFGPILTHIDGLRLEDQPNYEMIEALLRKCIVNNRLQEHPYDWEVGRKNTANTVQSAGQRRSSGASGGGGRKTG